MEMVLALGAVLAGFAGLMKGGDWTIDGAVIVARGLGISDLLVGFTVVAFGTSLPELFVSVDANLAGQPGLALGSVVGSNIANILLIVGAAAVASRIPLADSAGRRFRRNGAVMMMATVILVLLGTTGGVARWQGGLMFALLVAYVAFQYWREKRRIAGGGADSGSPPAERRRLHSAAALVGGLLLVVAGAELLIWGAVEIARAVQVRETVIGLTMVAFGTSLPELATCLSAARKNKADVVFGNVVGSNVFNILSIVGLTALVKTLPVDAGMARFDLWVMAAASLAFVLWLVVVGRVGQRLGFLLLSMYVVYIIAPFTGLSGIPVAG